MSLSRRPLLLRQPSQALPLPPTGQAGPSAPADPTRPAAAKPLPRTYLVRQPTANAGADAATATPVDRSAAAVFAVGCLVPPAAAARCGAC